MKLYLYKISIKRSNVRSKRDPKPTYYVAESKESAAQWVNRNMANGLSVTRITRLAEQISRHVFLG